MVFLYFGFSTILLESVFFLGPLIPLFGLLDMSAVGFKARVDPFTSVLHQLHAMDSSDSPLGATPVDLFVARMAAEPFLIHLLVQF